MPTAPPPPPPPPPPRSKLYGEFQAWFLRQSIVARVTGWLLAFVLAGLLLAALRVARGLGIILIVLCAIPLAVCLIILLWRWFSQRVLWSVRNRLTLTYLLMGLAPIVLFSSLNALSLYLFAGQYSTTTALADLNVAEKQLADSTLSLVTLHQLPQPATPAAPTAPATAPALPSITTSVLKDGVWQPLTREADDATIALTGQPAPAWLKPPFLGLVEHEGKLYLCSAQFVPTPHGPQEIIGTRAVSRSALGEIGENIGVLRVFSHAIESTETHSRAPAGNASQLRMNTPRDAQLLEQARASEKDPEVDVEEAPAASTEKHAPNSQVSLKAGKLPAAANLLDPPIVFSSPLPIYHWSTGRRNSSLIIVFSRPSILYKRLFATATASGRFIRIVLISVGIGFAVLELFAVGMAIAVSRTIVSSVRDLYLGTRAIDAGDLGHRIRAQRHDQLGDLARSFNGMSASIADLLVQQREKDKLLNELSIAQEVQRTLFPDSPASTPGLELHAVCIPALSVGGDYFDFIFGAGNAVCLTLGDISGKGMSAALLMASLHSSIRALSFDRDGATEQHVAPASLMRSINGSLYRSTQSARYATLFAACYDAQTRELTYVNGGHLPPLVIAADGAIARLETGGPVVGLLPGITYLEAAVKLNRGDLLVAFTDGLTEPERGTEEFGERRLIETIAPLRGRPLPEIMAKTLAAVQEWIGEREQPDDITLLLARQL